MNTPNKLTIFRIFLVPLVVAVLIVPYADLGIIMPVYQVAGVDLPLENILALVLFALASFTDFLDGYLARKHNDITTFGAFLDPIADKVLVNTLFIVLASLQEISVIPVLLMVWRDTIVDGIRMMASKKGVTISAGSLGKLKTVLQMVTIVLLLLKNIPFEQFGLPIANIMLWLSTLVSVISGISYFIASKDIIMESM